MKPKRTLYPGFQMGTSLLLVILTALCLMVFAALSLSSALRDYGYSKMAAEKTLLYYEADSKANEILGELMDSGELGIHSYFVPLDNERQLSVTVELTEDSYTILEWREVSSAAWEGDTTLPVLGSDLED